MKENREETSSINFALDKDLKDKLSIVARMSGQNMRKILVGLVEEYVENNAGHIAKVLMSERGK